MLLPTAGSGGGADTARCVISQDFNGGGGANHTDSAVGQQHFGMVQLLKRHAPPCELVVLLRTCIAICVAPCYRAAAQFARKEGLAAGLREPARSPPAPRHRDGTVSQCMRLSDWGDRQ